MKRFIIAVSLLVLAAATAFFSGYSARKAIETSSDALYACTVKEKNKELDTLKIKEAVSVWNSEKNIMLLTSVSDDFSEIENNFTRLEYYIMFPDFEESSKLCYETAAMLEKLSDDFGLNFQNIF